MSKTLMEKNWINRRNVQSWQHFLIGTIHVGTVKESYLCNHSSHGDSSRQFGFNTPFIAKEQRNTSSCECSEYLGMNKLLLGREYIFVFRLANREIL
jgi:hypothetical protein